MAVINAGNFNFYKPGQTPNALPGFEGSELYDWMAELEREAYFGNWLGRQNLMGTDMRSDLARSLLSRFNLGYEATLFENPEEKWTDYLDRQAPDLNKVLAGFDPQSRGYSPQSSVAVGQARWLPRSR